MKNKHTNTIQKRNILARALDVPVASLRLSTDTFYGAFLAVSVVLTILLYGASGAVANTEIAFAPVINPRQVILENKVDKLVGGYPIAQMTEIIAKQDKTTAAFLVGIAKKESNWGRFSNFFHRVRPKTANLAPQQLGWCQAYSL